MIQTQMGDYRSLIKHRYLRVLGYSGIIFMAFSFILLIPVLFCFFFPEEWKNSTYFFESALISFTVGLIFRIFSRSEVNPVLTVQDGVITVLMIWSGNIIFSSLPFIFSKTLNFTQAVFEATSGWTTTGLTVVDVTKISKLLLVWRSLMQYFGGAGFAIIVCSSIIGPMGLGFYRAEGRTDDLLPNVKKTAKMIMIIYVTYAIAGMVAYKLAGMSFFDAFNHSLTALATGGFSTKAGSIGEFGNLRIECITMILMILGTTGFGVHFTIWKGNFKAFVRNPEPWLFFTIISIFTPLIMLKTSGIIFKSPPENVRHSLFQAISALTGTGFSTVSFNNWPAFPMMLLILLMIFGGGMDSTSGGLKLFRIFVFLRIVIMEVESFILPKGIVKSYSVWKGESRRFIDSSMVMEVLLIFSLYFITYIVGVLVLLGYGYGTLDSMFEYASALSTVGLSVGITSPDAPTGVLWVETIGMFLGRLEFLAVLYAIAKIFRDVKKVL